MLNLLFLKWYDGNWYCDYDTYLTQTDIVISCKLVELLTA